MSRAALVTTSPTHGGCAPWRHGHTDEHAVGGAGGGDEHMGEDVPTPRSVDIAGYAIAYSAMCWQETKHSLFV